MTFHGDDVSRFRAAVECHLGLQFDDSKLPQLAEVLLHRAHSQRLSGAQYVDRLASNASTELAALAEHLTVGETYFFRNVDQFRVFGEVVLSQGARARGPLLRPIRVLSAGCSTGEEPYSLAMSVHERLGSVASVSIVAVDLDPAALDRARRGRYSMWALRETPAELRERWFTVDGREFVLSASIRGAVTFEQGNLATDDPELWAPRSYDVIFCRNVMMYFSPEHATSLARRFESSLVPGGYLFLGHAETLRGLSTEFDLCHSHDTFYYRRSGAGPDRTSSGTRSTGSRSAIAVSRSGSMADAGAWVEAIQSATDRVQHLLAPASRAGPPVVDVDAAGWRQRWVVGRPLALLQEERYAEALDVVDALPPGAAADSDIAMLRAVLLTHNGEFERAEDACRELLEIDGVSAGAHYLLALCRERAGDISGAIRHDQVAVHVDPSFAMARMHLGLLGRRRGDLVTVRREFTNAIVLLKGEDPSRLMLFGGGFTREALISMCRTHTARLGDRS